MNPMVQNMVQGYEAAQYEYVWISTSRIKGEEQLHSHVRNQLRFKNPGTSPREGSGSRVCIDYR